MSAVVPSPMRFFSVTSAHRVAGEVDDDVEALCLGDGDRAVGERCAEQTAVAADLDEWSDILLGLGVECELVVAGVGGVENAKVILRVRPCGLAPAWGCGAAFVSVVCAVIRTRDLSSKYTRANGRLFHF